ncbi:MAG: DUF883 family protein [Proteobacteria bacterium]|nr:DUF883 family protein [Pseudomonadota bacterium]MDE3208581.1 DUF883 family protein [Pseudomonadota bacterium]
MSKSTPSIPGSGREKLLSDVKAVIHDAEDLLKVTASQTGEQVMELRKKAESRLSDLRERLSDLDENIIERTRVAAQKTDAMVRENPWGAAGIGLGVGILLGLLIGRR